MSLYIQSFEPLNKSKDAFHVNASFPAHETMTVKSLLHAWSELTDNASSIVPGSIKTGGRAPRGQLISFIVKRNNPSIAKEDAGDRFQAIAANIFQDKKDGKTWRLENGRLVMAAQDDLSALLQSRMARTSGTMIFASAHTPFNHGIRPSIFDYGVYFNTKTGKLDSGWMITDGNQVMVASLDGNGELDFIDPAAVIDTIRITGLDQDDVPGQVKEAIRRVSEILTREIEKRNIATASRYGTVQPGESAPVALPVGNEASNYPTTAEFNSRLTQQVLNYMGGLYSGSSFYKALESAIKLRRNVANEDLPLTTMRA